MKSMYHLLVRLFGCIVLVISTGCTLDLNLDQIDSELGGVIETPKDLVFGRKMASQKIPLCVDGYILDAVQVSPRRTVLGGLFSYIGSCSGNALRFSRSGELSSALLTQIQNGENMMVTHAVPDPDGGWYVSRTIYEGPTPLMKQVLYKLNGDGSKNLSWNPNIDAKEIHAMKVSGASLFISFTNSADEAKLQAIDKVTGAVDSLWDPAPNNTVYGIDANSSTLFVSGIFTNISSQGRRFIAAYNLADLSLQSWPNEDPCYGMASCPIRSISASDALVAYTFEDEFSNLPTYGAIDVATGLLIRPAQEPYNKPKNVKVDGNSIYLSGFTSGFGQKAYLKELNTANGNTLHMNSPIAGKIRAMAEDGAGGHFVSGEFTDWEGTAVSRFVHLDSSGDIDPTYPIQLVSGSATAIVKDGSRVILGGLHRPLGSGSSVYLSAFDSTGTRSVWGTTFSASPNIKKLRVSSNYLIVQGTFTTVGGQPRSNIAFFKRSDLTLDALTVTTNGSVESIEVSGDILFVGGDFTTINGESRKNFAVIDLSTNSVLSFAPAPNARVQTISVSSDRLYIAGRFTETSGQQRGLVAAYDLNTLALTTFDPLSAAKPDTSTLAAGAIYLKEFNSQVFIECRGVTVGLEGAVSYFMSLHDKTTGMTWWRKKIPSVYQGNFPSLQIMELGSRVLMGMTNDTAGTIADSSLVKVTGTDLKIDGNFAIEVTGRVDKVFKDSGNRLFIAGEFTNVNSSLRYNAAQVDATTGTLASWTPKIDGAVDHVAVSKDEIFVIGTFKTYGGMKRNSLAAVDSETWSPTDWTGNLKEGSAVYDLHLAENNRFYVGGTFVAADGVSHPNLMAINVETGQVIEDWGPVSLLGTVTSMQSKGSRLFVGGAFTDVNAMPSLKLFEIDMNSSQVSTLPAAITIGSVMQTALVGNTLYFAGFFSAVNGTPLTSVAAVDIESMTLLNWDAKLNSGAQIGSMVADEENLYIGGFIASVDGNPRTNFAAYKLSDGSLHPLTLDTDGGMVTTLEAWNGKVAVGGQFAQINGENRDTLVIWNTKTSSFEPRPAVWPENKGHYKTLRVGSNLILVSMGGFTNFDRNRMTLMRVNAETLLPNDF